MWGRESYKPMGRDGQAWVLWAPLPALPPSASLATRQDSVAVGFGFWGLAQRCSWDFLSIRPLPRVGSREGFPPVGSLHSSHPWRLLPYIGDLRRETKET